jgi:hypothetical protein
LAKLGKRTICKISNKVYEDDMNMKGLKKLDVIDKHGLYAIR